MLKGQMLLAGGPQKLAAADRWAGGPRAGGLNLACYLTCEVPDQGFYRLVRRVAVCGRGFGVMVCSGRRGHVIAAGAVMGSLLERAAGVGSVVVLSRFRG